MYIGNAIQCLVATVPIPAEQEDERFREGVGIRTG